jgi:hypothetical protein
VERVDRTLEVRAHQSLHGVAVVTDDVGEHVGGEHRHPARFLLEDDLQQDRAREVIARLRVLHLEHLVPEDQVLHFRERDVRGRLGVVETAVRVLLDDARRHGGVLAALHQTGACAQLLETLRD